MLKLSAASLLRLWVLNHGADVDDGDSDDGDGDGDGHDDDDHDADDHDDDDDDDAVTTDHHQDGTRSPQT